MKGIKTILGALAVASLLTVSFSASAQENGNRDENGNIVRGAYETNGFWDNWFIGVGAGANATWEKDAVKLGFGGLAIDANVGKWFTPTIGARVGWKGLQNSLTMKDGFTTPYGDDTFTQHYIHADFLWSLNNSLVGYKETRFWDIIPYASAGALSFIKDGHDWEWALGAGILNDFRLGKRVDLALDLSLISHRSAMYQTAPHGTKFGFIPSATLGLIFNLGRTNFDRHTSITPVVVPVPFTVDQYNALKAKVDALEKENAALKQQIADLKNQKPDTVYVNTPGNDNVQGAATVYFNIGQAKLTDRELAHLDYFIDNVIAKSDKTFTVTGSADKGTGSAKRNATLSQQRADYVKDYIVSKGISADKINVTTKEGDLFSTPAASRVVVIE